MRNKIAVMVIAAVIISLILSVSLVGSTTARAEESRTGTVVWIHGGGWVGGNPWDNHGAVNAFANQGWNIERVAYAGSDTMYADILQGVWEATRYETGPVIVLGHSSGGHLASWIGVHTTMADLVINLGGPLDPGPWLDAHEIRHGSDETVARGQVEQHPLHDLSRLDSRTPQIVSYQNDRDPITGDAFADIAEPRDRFAEQADITFIPDNDGGSGVHWFNGWNFTTDLVETAQ